MLCLCYLRLKMLSLPFSAGKIILNLQGLRTVGVRMWLAVVLLICVNFGFLR